MLARRTRVGGAAGPCFDFIERPGLIIAVPVLAAPA